MNANDAIWKPNVTVAAVIERGGRFLLIEEETERALDAGIICAVWLTPDEIHANSDRHRTRLVMRCIEDYLAGKRYPLDLITHYA